MQNRQLFVIVMLLAASTVSAQSLAKATIVAGSPWGFPASAIGASANSAPLGLVTDVAAGPDGSVYAVDFTNQQICKISAQGILTVVAGGHSSVPFSFPASSAILQIGLAVDQANNLYFTQLNPPQVLKLTPAGGLTVFAGNAFTGFATDGAPATSTSLMQPSSLAIDKMGNVYIADGNYVRVVHTSGIMNTVAGGGTLTPIDIIPTTASLMGPMHITVDSAGDLFIADGTGIRNGVFVSERLFVAAGGLIQPITVQSSLPPFGLAIDSKGTLYYATWAGVERLRQLGPTVWETQPTQFAGSSPNSSGFSGDGGPALSALFNTILPSTSTVPYGGAGLAIDASDNLYLADTANARIRKISTVSSLSNIVSTVAGGGPYKFSGDGGPANAANMWAPMGLAFDKGGNLYIAENFGNRVRKVTPSGTISTVVGNSLAANSGDGGPAASASINAPVQVAADSSGNLFVAESGVIREVSSKGIASTVTSSAGRTVAVDSSGNLYSNGQNALVKVGVPGGSVTTIALPGLSKVTPSGLVFDSAGNLFVGDTTSLEIYKLTATGSLTAISGAPGSSGGDGGMAAQAFVHPGALAIDSLGNIYNISNSTGVRKITPSGLVNTIFVPPSPDLLVTGIAVDSGDHVYVSSYDDLVYRLDAAAPTLASISPTLASTGNPITFTVSGSGFDVDSEVMWNGAPRRTTYVSSKQLTAAIPATDLATLGSASITVLNPALGGALSAATLKFQIVSAAFSSSGVVNGASFVAGLSPGSIISIFGTNLAKGTNVATTVPLPALLGGTTVTLNGTPMPLLYAGPTQINAQVPFNATGTANLTVTTDSPTTQSVTVTPASPGIFQTGVGAQGVIVDNNTFALADVSHPVAAGSFIVIFCTGLGAVNPPVAEGTAAPSSPLSNAVTLPQVLFGTSNTPVTPLFAGLAPGFAGLYQVSVQVPASAHGTTRVSLNSNGVASNSVTFEVQ